MNPSAALRHQFWAITREGMRSLSARYESTASLIERGLSSLSNDERARICYNGGNPIVPEIENGVATVEIMGDLIARAPWWAKAYLGAVDPFDLADVFDALATDATVSALVIEIDCCGGSVAGTFEAAAALGRFQAAGKTVEVRAAGVLASAAYALVAGADKILATATTTVGSLGTMVVLCDESALMASMGVKLEVVSTGPLKGAGADGTISQAMRDQYQRHVDALNQVFKDTVAAGRGIANVDALFTGDFWIGADALSLDLIDAVISPADELDQAEGNAPAPEPVAPALDGEGDDGDAEKQPGKPCGTAPKITPAATIQVQAPTSKDHTVDPKLMATLAAMCQTHPTHAAALVAEANKPGVTAEGLQSFAGAQIAQAKEAAHAAEMADIKAKLAAAEKDRDEAKARADKAEAKAAHRVGTGDPGPDDQSKPVKRITRAEYEKAPAQFAGGIRDGSVIVA